MTFLDAALNIHPKQQYTEAKLTTKGGGGSGRLFEVIGPKVHNSFKNRWNLANIEGVVGIALVGIGLAGALGLLPIGHIGSYALLGVGGAMFMDALSAHAIHIVKMLLHNKDKKNDTLVLIEGNDEMEEFDESVSIPSIELKGARGSGGFGKSLWGAARSISDALGDLVAGLRTDKSANEETENRIVTHLKRNKERGNLDNEAMDKAREINGERIKKANLPGNRDN